MKRMMMTMLAAVLIGSVAVAQDTKQQGKRPEKKFDKTEMVKHRTDETVKKYGLNDKQAAKLLELNTQYADKMQPRGPRGHHGHGGPGMGRPPKPQTDGTTEATPQQPPKDGQKKGKRPELTEEQKAKMEAERNERDATMKAYDAELQKIMTADQYKSYKADMEKQRQRGPRPPRGGEKK